MKNVIPCIYRKNKTLDAIISFCSAHPSSTLAEGDWKRWRLNKKIGAIITLNYDNLLEACFNSKYRIGGLIPVGRFSEKQKKGKEGINVYHIHGYISFVHEKPKKADNHDHIVLTESDYYKEFNDANSFGNIKAREVLKTMPCLFIGCSMTDRNIRRILTILRQDNGSLKHFAILPPPTNPMMEEFEDVVLNSFGVTTFRLESNHDIGTQIEKTLMKLYLCDDRQEHEWDKAKKGTVNCKECSHLFQRCI